MLKPCCTKESAESKAIDDVAGFVRAINEPNRLRILCLLKQGELCVCDIFETLALPQNLASHHLKELKEAGLVQSRKEGTKVLYSRNESTIKHLTRGLTNITNI